jgi:hypothetical protein
MLISNKATQKLSVGKADALDLPLDSKLANYQVNLVGQFAKTQIEFAYPT